MSEPELSVESPSPSARELDGLGALTAYASLAALLTAIAATYAGVILTYSRFADAGPVILLAALACFVSSGLALLAAPLIWLRSGLAKGAVLSAAVLTGVAFVSSGFRLISWAFAEGKNPIVVLGPVGAAFGFAGLALLLTMLVSRRRSPA